MLKIYFRHGVIEVKDHEIISFEQSKWLDKYISFSIENRKKGKNKIDKDSFKIINIGTFCKMLENIRNRLKEVFNKKCEKDKSIKQQSKLTFNGIQKSYTKHISYNFKQKDAVMDKPIYAGSSISEMSKLHLYETSDDELQPFFGQESLQLLCRDSDGFVISISTNDIIKDLKDLEDLFNLSNLNENQELYSSKKERDIGKFELEVPKKIRMDEIVALRSIMFAFKCGDDCEKRRK